MTRLRSWTHDVRPRIRAGTVAVAVVLTGGAGARWFMPADEPARPTAVVRSGPFTESLVEIGTVADLQTLLSVVREQPVEVQVERQGEGEQKATLTVTVTPKKVAGTTYSPTLTAPLGLRYTQPAPARVWSVPSALGGLEEFDRPGRRAASSMSAVIG